MTDKPFNLNVFCHAPPQRDPEREAGWIDRARPLFAQFGATPPGSLHEANLSFLDDDDMLEAVLNARPKVVSFHFGLPWGHQIDALRTAGATLIATATSPAEALLIEHAGLDAIVAQGWQAGGHRGIFDPDGKDECLDTLSLLAALRDAVSLPLIAAGGIMDGRDIARVLDAGAVAAQMGTAFAACPESAADPAYRARLAKGGATVMTRVISGRPARCLNNRFTQWGADIDAAGLPAYPVAYDLGRALNSAAKAAAETGFGPHWAGTEAARTRAIGAGRLTLMLDAERRAAD